MGWPKGKPRGPRKKVAAKPAPKEQLAATFNDAPVSEPKQETAEAAPAQYYRNTRKAAVFCSHGRVEQGDAVPLSPIEAAASPWWEPCQKPD